jgi:hypothetical protein
MAERLNCVQNAITTRKNVLIRNKVAGFIVVGGQDNIQAMAGQMRPPARPRRSTGIDRARRSQGQPNLVHRFLGTDHFRRIHVIHDGLYPGF